MPASAATIAAGLLVPRFTALEATVARVSSERTASEEQDSARDYGRSAGLLTGALGIAGVLTYGYFAIASHNLSAEAYGDIVILWSVVFLLASTLFRPVEQLLASSLAEQEQAGVSSSGSLRSAAVIQGGLIDRHRARAADRPRADRGRALRRPGHALLDPDRLAASASRSPTTRAASSPAAASSTSTRRCS